LIRFISARQPGCEVHATGRRIAIDRIPDAGLLARDEISTIGSCLIAGRTGENSPAGDRLCGNHCRLWSQHFTALPNELTDTRFRLLVRHSFSENENVSIDSKA